MDERYLFSDIFFVASLILGGVGSWIHAILYSVSILTSHEIFELRPQGECLNALSIGEFVIKLQMIGSICLLFHAMFVIFAMILIYISQNRNDKKYQHGCVGVIVSFVCLSLGGILFLISLVYLTAYRDALVDCLL